MISITLPSLSEALVARAIANIDATAREPCQIIVVCPGPPPEPTRSSIRWIVDRAPNEGANAAHEQAFRWATGEYVLAWVDDHALVPNWDTFALAAFEKAERETRGCGPLALGLRHVGSDQIGTCFGMYYPYFPMMRRARVAEVGGWLSGDYKRGFADVDLALRVWKAGGRCVWADPGVVEKLPDDDRKIGDLLHNEVHATEADLELFIDRWGHSQFGHGWPTGRLRDFNIDKAIT